MKFTDIIAETLIANNITSVFGLQGGAVAHIFDSLEKYKIQVIYTHHESTASFAAAVNSKATSNIGCAVVTTGPGCTNAITGLMGSWQDSIPCLYLSGQVRSEHTSYNKPVRQVGTQEVNIVDIVKPLCKYAKTIKNLDEIQKELNKAIEIAKSGRPGPVWLDLPLEFQWGNSKFERKHCINIKPKAIKIDNTKKFEKAMNLIKEAKNPIFIIGYGVHLSNTEERIKKFITKNNFRVVSTWTAAGIFGTKNKFNLGIIGMSGQAGANKAVFNSDLIICLGTHLAIPHTTTLFANYATKAKKIFINIDQNQLKNLNLKSDLSICTDINNFINFFQNKKFNNKQYDIIDKFKKLNWKKPDSTASKYVNSNIFFRKLTKIIKKNDAIVVDGGGTALYTGFQSSYIKENQRIFCSSAISSMGTGLAETIGVYASNKFKKIYTIIGDGSMLMNIQDLQSISDMNIPAVICVINNNGYLAIRHTQESFLGGRYYGTHPEYNLGVLNFKKAAETFNLKYIRLSNLKEIDDICKKLINYNKPVLCEVVTSENQKSLFSQKYKDNGDGTFSPLSLEFMN